MKFLGVLWGLRLRQTEQELALASLSMLPSAHYKDVGVRITSFRSSIPTPPIPLFTLRRAPRDGSTQNSGPSGSLVLSREASTSSASCRFSPAHCNRLFASLMHPPIECRLPRDAEESNKASPHTSNLTAATLCTSNSLYQLSVTLCTLTG